MLTHVTIENARLKMSSTTTQSIYREIRSSDLVSVTFKTKNRTKWDELSLRIPDFPKYLTWKLTILGTVILNYILVTLNLSLTQNSLSTFQPFYIAFDLIYLIHFALLSLHKFYKPLKAKLPTIISTPLIYLVLDAISLLPQVILFARIFDNRLSYLIPYFRLATLLRLRSVFVLENELEKLQRKRLAWYCLQYCSVLFLVVHSTIFAWYLIEVDMGNQQGKFSKSAIGPMVDFNPGKWYFMHVYGSVQILFGAGYGEIVPRSSSEVILFIELFVIGQILLAWLLANIALMFINEQTNEVHIAQKQEDIARYVEDTDAVAQTKTLQYYHAFWPVNPPLLLEVLPSPLRSTLNYDMSCGLLNRSMLLKKLPELVLRKLASSMKHIRLLPGDVIFHQYVVKTSMVCVESGVLEVLNNEDGESPVISFRKGTILGEVSLFFNFPSKATVAATKLTDLSVLEKNDFIRIMRLFPDVLREMKRTIDARLENVSAKRKPIIKPFEVTNLRRLKMKLSKTTEFGGEVKVDVSEDYSKLYKVSRGRNVLYESIVSVDDCFPWILNANSYLLKTWKYINGFIQVIYCLAYPYSVVFLRLEEPMPEFGFIVDVLSFIDVILQCITPIRIEEEILLTNIPEIINRRLDEWRFDLDIFSLFPIEVWGYIFENPVNRNRYYDLFKFNRLLRLNKIIDIVKLFNNSKRRTSNIGRVIPITLYALLILYYCSCILYLNACFHDLCNSHSWYYLGSFEWDEKNRPKHPAVDSIFFATTTFFFSGFVDYLPRTQSDVAIVLIIMLGGLIFNSYFTSQLIANEILHVEGSTLRPLFRSFSTFCRISLSARRRIQRLLKIQPCLSSGVTRLFIKDTASPYLRSLVNSCKLKNVLAETSLFQMVDNYFLTLIEKEVRLLELPNNETLYYLGNATREMFILQKGFCDVYNSEEGFERNVGPGFQFGMLEMLYGIPKKHTIITSTDCVFVRIDYGVLYKILGLFPKENDALEATICGEEMARAVKRMQTEGEMDALFEARAHRDHDQICFINQTKNWPNYCQVYRRKMGSLWLLGVLLMPVSFHPEGFFLTLWCTVRCFLIVLSCILEPLMILSPPFADELYWWLVICHASIYLDMYLLLHIAYYDGKGAFKTHPAYTSWYYLTHGFLLDLISAMPWEKLMPYSNLGGKKIDLIAPHHHHSAWKLVKLLQVYKVYKFFGYFESDMFKRIGSLRLLQITLALVMVVNVFANLGMSQICWYQFDGLTGRKETVWEDGNGAIFKGYLSCKGTFCRNNTLFRQLTDPLDMLLIGVYEVVNIITSTSLGHLEPATSAIPIGTTLLIITGFIIFSIFTSIVASIMLERVDETFEFRQSVTHLMDFFESKKLCSELKKKAFRHFELTWERTKAQGDKSCSFNESQAEVPLLNDIFLNYYQHILEEVPLFYDLDANLLRIFVDKIKMKHFRKGQTIVRPKDLISDIFIVASGQVEVIPDGQGPTEILEVSGVFGNIQRSSHSMSTVTAVARRNVELWVINTAELFSIVKNYPVVLGDMDNFWKEKPFCMSSLATADDSSSQSQEVDVVDQMESEVEDVKRKSSILLDKYKPVQFCIPQRWFRFALKPNHDVFKVLDFITILSSIMNVFAIPYVFVTQDTTWVGYVYLVLEPVYYLRIFFKLHRSHINFYGNLVKSNSKIYKIYLNSSLQVFWDIAPNLPLYLTCFVFPREEWFFAYSCLRLIHLLRFIYVSEYFSTYGKKLGVKNWLPLAKTVLYYICLTHILSCIWFMLICPFDSCLQHSWISKFGNDILERHTYYRMILSYYYVLNLLTTTGIGDVFPENKLELFFTLVTILIGKIMISIMIGSVLRYIYQSRKKLSEFERDSKLLVRYLEKRNVSNYLIGQTWGFLKNQWDYDGYLIAPKIFEELPYPLRQDISVFLYGDFLRNTFLFKDLDETLLRQICCKLNPRTFFHNDYIVRSGIVDSTMYLILQGDVCVSTRHHDLTETRHVVLHAKDLFGVAQGLGLEAPHSFCYRPHGHRAEVLTLRFGDWAPLLGFFPGDGGKVFARAQGAYLQ